MESENTKSAGRIQELDGLRAFAVICVVVYHMYCFGGSIPAGPFWVGNVLTFLGTSAVRIFFVISGSIITLLLLREHDAQGRVSLKAFYIRRIFRIIPPLMVYLLALWLLVVGHVVTVPSRDLIISGLFLTNVGLFGSESWLVHHTWSLTAEEQFYVLFPPLLCLLYRSRRGVQIMAFALLFLCCTLAFPVEIKLSRTIHPDWMNATILAQFRYILIGVLLALCKGSWLDFLNQRSRIWPAAIIVINYLMGLLAYPFYFSISANVFFAVEPVLCGLFTLWFVRNSVKCNILRSPTVQFVGAISYSTYPWQQFFTGPSKVYLNWNVPESPASLI